MEIIQEQWPPPADRLPGGRDHLVRGEAGGAQQPGQEGARGAGWEARQGLPHHEAGAWKYSDFL